MLLATEAMFVVLIRVSKRKKKMFRRSDDIQKSKKNIAGIMAVEMQGATEHRITCGDAETEAQRSLGSPLMTPYRSRNER